MSLRYGRLAALLSAYLQVGIKGLMRLKLKAERQKVKERDQSKEACGTGTRRESDSSSSCCVAVTVLFAISGRASGLWRRWKQARLQAGRRRRRYLLHQVPLADSSGRRRTVGRCLFQNVRSRYHLSCAQFAIEPCTFFNWAERLNHQFVLGNKNAFCRLCADFRRFAPETVAGLLFSANAVPPCNSGSPKPQDHNFLPHSSGNVCTHCGYNKFNSATLKRLLQVYGGRLAPISADPSDWLVGQGVDIERKDAQVVTIRKTAPWQSLFLGCKAAHIAGPLFVRDPILTIENRLQRRKSTTVDIISLCCFSKIFSIFH